MAENDIDVERPDGADGERQESDIVEVREIDNNGEKEKVVSLSALHAAREENRVMKETLGRLQPLMPEFQEFLNSKHQPRQPQAPVRQASTEMTDEEKEELEATAQVLGFVNPETGEADLVRTKHALAILDRRAGRVVSRAVGPVAGSVAEQQARRHREAAYDKMFVDGAPVADPDFVDMAFDSLPAEFAADPNVAGVVHLLAAGLQYLEERKGAVQQNRGGRRASADVFIPEQRPARMVRGRQSTREPMFIEGSHGRVQRDDDEQMSGFSVAAARARGKSPEQWAKQREKVGSRRSDVLDDIY